MKNKKIVDYIVVREEIRIENLSSRLEKALEKKTTELANIKQELEALKLSEVQQQISKYKFEIEARVNNKTGKKVIYSPYDFNDPVDEYSNEEMEDKIKVLLEKEKQLKELEKSILVKIEALEKELAVANEFKNSTLTDIKRNSFEESIIKLLKQGYVPQGGVVEKRINISQAMVKYEE